MRSLTFNGQPLSVEQLSILERLEQQYGLRLDDGAYWYDAKTGAAGRWGGPTLGFLPPNLPLPGPLPPNASGGGTSTYINGRELHPQDVALLSQMIGSYVPPARYWVDSMGNGGLEGMPASFNLYALAQNARAQQGGGAPSVNSYGFGKSKVTIGNFGGGDMMVTLANGTSWWPGK